MNSVGLKGMLYSMPAGRLRPSVSIAAMTRLAVSRALEPGCWKIWIGWAGRPVKIGGAVEALRRQFHAGDIAHAGHAAAAHPS